MPTRSGTAAPHRSSASAGHRPCASVRGCRKARRTSSDRGGRSSRTSTASTRADVVGTEDPDGRMPPGADVDDGHARADFHSDAPSMGPGRRPDPGDRGARGEPGVGQRAARVGARRRPVGGGAGTAPAGSRPGRRRARVRRRSRYGPRPVRRVGRSEWVSAGPRSARTAHNGVACGGMNTDLRGVTGSCVLLASCFRSGPITGHAIEGDGGVGVRGFAGAAGGDHFDSRSLTLELCRSKPVAR